MPVGVLTTDYIDVWCNSATDTPHKIRVGDMIAVKWNADARDRECPRVACCASRVRWFAASCAFASAGFRLACTDL